MEHDIGAEVAWWRVSGGHSEPDSPGVRLEWVQRTIQVHGGSERAEMLWEGGWIEWRCVLRRESLEDMPVWDREDGEWVEFLTVGVWEHGRAGRVSATGAVAEGAAVLGDGPGLHKCSCSLADQGDISTRPSPYSFRIERRGYSSQIES